MTFGKKKVFFEVDPNLANPDGALEARKVITYLNDIPISDAEKAESNFFDSMAAGVKPIKSNVPIGKQVI